MYDKDRTKQVTLPHTETFSRARLYVDSGGVQEGLAGGVTGALSGLLGQWSVNSLSSPPFQVVGLGSPR